MSSLLDLHLQEVEDPSLLEQGTEVEWKIISAKVAPSQEGNRDVYTITEKAVDFPTALPLTVRLSTPNKNDTPDTAYFLKLQFKKFFEAHEVDLSTPGDPSDWIGLTGWGVVKHREYNGEMQHDIARWIKKG